MLSFPSFASAPIDSGFTFKEAAQCSDKEHDPYGDDRLVARHDGKNVQITAFVGLTCNYRVRNPKALFLEKSVTLSVESYSLDEGWATGCLCSQKLEYTLTESVPKKTKIYFILDGVVTSETISP